MFCRFWKGIWWSKLNIFDGSVKGEYIFSGRIVECLKNCIDLFIYSKGWGSD